MSAWIVKQVGYGKDENEDFPYLSAPGEGSGWGEELSGAHRFPTLAAAHQEIGRLTQEHRRSDWRWVVKRVVKRTADDHYMAGWNDALKKAIAVADDEEGHCSNDDEENGAARVYNKLVALKRATLTKGSVR